jgi:transcriptional regulator with XRE-family HTH domain
MLLPALRFWRHERDLTQERLAERISMRRTTIWRIEAGRPALMRTARRLADALGVEVIDLAKSEAESPRRIHNTSVTRTQRSVALSHLH